jgi:hypothetical protein
MAGHLTLVFACVLVILFLIYKSKKITWWVIVIISILLTFIIILGPETFLDYICCATSEGRIIIGLLFIIEFAISVSIISFLMHLRNKKLREKYGDKS